MNQVDAAIIHGRTMLVNGLEHAIYMIDTYGDEGKKTIRERIEKEKAELETLEAEACND